MYKYSNCEARFAEIEEILVSTDEIDVERKTVTACGVPIRSDGKKMSVDNADVRTLVVANSGAGKTRRIILPLIISCTKAGNSMIMHDPKGELLTHSYHLLEEQGYDVKVINLSNPKQGDCYNPFSYPVKRYKEGDVSKATEYFMEFACSLYEPEATKDRFWTNTSENYLTGLCLLACELMYEKDVNIANIYNLHLQGNDRTGMYSGFQEYFKKGKRKEGNIWKLLESTVSAPNETKSSILSVMTQIVGRLHANEDMLALLSGDMDWDVRDIAAKKVAVFFLTKDEGSFYSNVVSAIIQQIYAVLVDLADTQYQGRLPKRVEFILDEFGNMAPLQNINEKITASRSRNIRFHLVVQSLEQLSLRYTQQEARILLGNCDDLLYMFSTDLELLKYISERCGDKISEFTGERSKLLSVSALQHLDKESGECLVLQGRNYPYVSYLPDISQYRLKLSLFDWKTIPERTVCKVVPFDFQKLLDDERQSIIDELLKDGVPESIFCEEEDEDE